MKKQTKGVNKALKYEKTPFKLPTKVKIKKRSKRAVRWSKAQYNAVSFARTNRFMQGLVVAVFTWLGVFYILSEWNEPIALCFATLTTYLLLGRIFGFGKIE
jgi:hypothetical protein